MPAILTGSARRIVALFPLALVAGCAAAPDLGPPPTPRAPDSIAAGQTFARIAAPTGAAEAPAWPADRWWRSYGDPQLDGLIEEGLRGSPDIAAALARLRRAGGLAEQAGAALWPRLDVQGDATFDKQSYNNGFPKEFLPQGWNDTGSVAAAAGFDLDLWGRNRAALAAATSEARAALIDTRQAELMLTTAIARAYVELEYRFINHDIARATLELRTANRDLIAQRQANGLENRVSLRQADADAATARAGLGEATEALELIRHQIAALVGAGPDRGLALTRPTLAPASVGGLPADATTDLIGRRPDIAGARARVEAAASRIKVARADFYPAISLSAIVGMQSLGLDNLFKGGSTYGSVGPAISLPIFHGGALRGRYRSARADYDEAVANYDRTVLAAYREVADAATTERSLDQRVADARTALAASREAYALARQRYDGGLSTYLDVLQIEDRMLVAQSRLATLESAARASDINLIGALGGGFDRTAAATVTTKDVPNG